MMYRLFGRLFFVALIATVCGCAPGLGKTLKISDGSEPSSELTWKRAPQAGSVALRAVHDSRKRTEIGQISGRKMSADGDIRLNVRERLAEQLKKAGIETAQDSSAYLEVEVLNWFVEVGPGFPTTEVVARASLMASLLTPQNELLYRGRYGGDASEVNVFFSESDVEGILSDCMDRAVNELVNDSQLLHKLERSRQFSGLN